MLASEEFQRKSWFEEGPENTFSPDELICEFFDDLFFEEFLASKEVDLDNEQRRAGEELYASLDSFSRCTPSHLEAAIVFRYPQWHKIRTLATLFLHRL